MDTLNSKIRAFEKRLTDLERLRLRQLTSVDDEGNFLAGTRSLDESIARHKETPLPSVEARRAINDSLSKKLSELQDQLTEDEKRALTLKLSGAVGVVQSSFGVSE